jgi:hypothetical protein
MNQLAQYDEMALRYNTAYAAFKSIYETKNIAPINETVERESVFVPVALMVMIIASVIVSGSRTVLEFGGGLVGLSAFVMLEGAIVAYAFVRTRINFSDERMDGVRTLANRGLALASIVAVAANVHSVIKGAGVVTPEAVTVIILILVAISAPTLAFISGDIMALETMRNSYRKRKAEVAYSQAVKDWNNGLDTAWAREKKSWGVKVDFDNMQQIQATVTPVPDVTLQDLHTAKKESPALKKALAWFELNPDQIDATSRSLVESIGVSHMSISRAQRIIKGEIEE